MNEEKKLKKYSIEIETDNIEAVKATLELVCKIIEVKKKNETRTLSQNNSIHLFCEQLAQDLNEKNCDMRMVIKPEIEMEWSKYTVKEFIWKPLQKALFGIDSTTKLLKTKQIDNIYKYIVKIIPERTHGEVIVRDFPSDEFYR